MTDIAIAHAHRIARLSLLFPDFTVGQLERLAASGHDHVIARLQANLLHWSGFALVAILDAVHQPEPNPYAEEALHDVAAHHARMAARYATPFLREGD